MLGGGVAPDDAVVEVEDFRLDLDVPLCKGKPAATPRLILPPNWPAAATLLPLAKGGGIDEIEPLGDAGPPLTFDFFGEVVDDLLVSSPADAAPFFFFVLEVAAVPFLVAPDFVVAVVDEAGVADAALPRFFFVFGSS